MNAQGLTVNYRSVPPIVGVANKLSGRSDTADRAAPACLNGAYFIAYKKAEKEKLQSAFQSMLDSAQVAHANAVVADPVTGSTNGEAAKKRRDKE